MHAVGYVKQYDKIFRNGSYNTNAALFQHTPSKVSSLICNSGSHAAFKSNSKLSPSIIKSTNQVSRLAATLSVASTTQPKDLDSDNDSFTRQECPNKHILTQNQVLLIDYIQPSGEKRGNDEKDFSGANKDDTSSSILHPSILQPRIFKNHNALVEAAVELVEQTSNLQNLNNKNPNMADESTNPKEDLSKHTILQHQRIEPVELEEGSSTRLSSPNSNTISIKVNLRTQKISKLRKSPPPTRLKFILSLPPPQTSSIPPPPTTSIVPTLLPPPPTPSKFSISQPPPPTTLIDPTLQPPPTKFIHTALQQPLFIFLLENSPQSILHTSPNNTILLSSALGRVIKNSFKNKNQNSNVSATSLYIIRPGNNLNFSELYQKTYAKVFKKLICSTYFPSRDTITAFYNSSVGSTQIYIFNTIIQRDICHYSFKFYSRFNSGTKKNYLVQKIFHTCILISTQYRYRNFFFLSYVFFV